jgi:hypothetical protein
VACFAYCNGNTIGWAKMSFYFLLRFGFDKLDFYWLIDSDLCDVQVICSVRYTI